MAFSFYRSFTVDHALCGAADSSGFPVLICTTNAAAGTKTSFKTTGNGGKVQNASGFDIRPYSDSGLTSALTFQLVTYDATTGIFEMWVNVSTLSHTSDTVIYLGYGDSGISTDGSSTSTWDSNFNVVYHVKDGSTLSLSDATSNAMTLTNVNSVSAGTGQVDGGAIFSGSNYLNHGPNTAFDGSDYTLECWVNPTTAASGTQSLLSLFPSSGSPGQYFFYLNSSGKLAADIPFVLGNIIVGSTTLSNGAWARASLRKNGTAYDLFLNGVSDAAQATNISVLVTGGDFDIGEVSLLSGAKLTGTMDEVQISKTGRSDSWILAGYNNQFVPDKNNSGGFYTVGAETAAGGGGNVVSGGVTEGKDATSGSIKVAIKASGGVTEGKDVTSGTIKLASKVSGGATEGPDAAAGSVKVALKVSGGVTEGADFTTGAISVGSTHVSGSLTEGADATGGGSVKVALHLSGGPTEGKDITAGNLLVAVKVSGGVTEGADFTTGSITATSRTISGGFTEGADRTSGIIISGTVSQGGHFLPLTKKEIAEARKRAKAARDKEEAGWDQAAKDKADLHQQIMKTLHPEKILGTGKVEKPEEDDDEADIEMLLLYG